MSDIDSRTELLKQIYGMEKHVEGGSFAEVYTAPFESSGRSFSGSIYFLLEKGEISHFHQIDCDEIWYYHEGCGLRITMLSGEGVERCILGGDLQNGERAMAVIPKGTVFAAENLDIGGYTFISCATIPKFDFSGFKFFSKAEIRERYPDLADEIDYLVYELI